jgi:hypothetical protein
MCNFGLSRGISHAPGHQIREGRAGCDSDRVCSHRQFRLDRNSCRRAGHWHKIEHHILVGLNSNQIRTPGKRWPDALK